MHWVESVSKFFLANRIIDPYKLISVSEYMSKVAQTFLVNMLSQLPWGIVDYFKWEITSFITLLPAYCSGNVFAKLKAHTKEAKFLMQMLSSSLLPSSRCIWRLMGLLPAMQIFGSQSNSPCCNRLNREGQQLFHCTEDIPASLSASTLPIRDPLKQGLHGEVQ